ncbi:cobyric acid synthase [Granulicatella sp. zg-ZJ]|uniref:cobyric acid synthase n=1 Tax=unclassified Granulicatella TaxID=2630493 RepID=UPI0013C21675|nr:MULTISPECIES: cobyric acid synthase [unclassified Granulicatella]MBS4749703.1 cobyric acid synthase [Carnobacteriaceae bacterium zg-ZUI78]NEW61832.1 cobyric acid synthase [Granulicatella sp. zg-ZJ]NEW65906.1 cobyric acid synthase [Granulicatella sp. zg-84]QMI85135.1 cobyric acid synthase [Carnobacteriaceae bacterium zg-84]
MAKSIMVQGTASDAGKSIIVAGLCRIFKQDGLSVVPFKSQNMALNSFITKKGAEMGRAQVFQSEAAGVDPDVRMNPVLLKPTSDRKSQIVFMGEVLTDMDAVEYHEFKQQLLPKIKEVYEQLSDENDVIVLEGAGSPAEINLNDRDIVNMGMAKLVDAPVILVADIDKGGVFASIYGTIQLMPEEDRKRVKGVIINKFRGDVALLQSGIDMIESLTNVKVLGVVPYAHLDIDSEDSVALVQKSRRFDTKKDLDVAIVGLKRMSNFTDFHSLEIQPDVSVRYVMPGDAIGLPDLLILPGSKNTIEDMHYLRESGLEKEILHCLEKDVHIFGICGGYQLLGKKMTDPLHVESSIEEIEGLGLLDACTTFKSVKRTTQVKADHDGHVLEGYEIHMGETTIADGVTPFSTITVQNGEETSRLDGAIGHNGQVQGTYLHGVFDNLDWTRDYLNGIRVKKGLEPITEKPVTIKEFKDREYDKLATILRNSLDMEQIYKILNKED